MTETRQSFGPLGYPSGKDPMWALTKSHGDCLGFFTELQKCFVVSDVPERECQSWKEDYTECKTHRKEVFSTPHPMLTRCSYPVSNASTKSGNALPASINPILQACYGEPRSKFNKTSTLQLKKSQTLPLPRQLSVRKKHFLLVIPVIFPQILERGFRDHGVVVL